MAADLDALITKYSDDDSDDALLNIIVIKFTKAKGGLTTEDICKDTSLDPKRVEKLLTKYAKKDDLFEQKKNYRNAMAFYFKKDAHAWLIEELTNKHIAQLKKNPKFIEAVKIYANAIANANATTFDEAKGVAERVAYYDYITQEHEAQSWDADRKGKTLLEERVEAMCKPKDRPDHWLDGMLRNTVKRWAPHSNFLILPADHGGQKLILVHTNRELFDNIITPADRQPIYDFLVSAGLASENSRNFCLSDGVEWGHHFFELKEEKICAYANVENVWKDALEKQSCLQVIYSVLKDEPLTLVDNAIKDKLLKWGLIKKIVTKPYPEIEGSGSSVIKLATKILKYSAHVRMTVLEHLGNNRLEDVLNNLNFDLQDFGELGLHTKDELEALAGAKYKTDLKLPVFFAFDFKKYRMTKEKFMRALSKIHNIALPSQTMPFEEEVTNARYGEEISGRIARILNKFNVTEHFDDLLKKAKGIVVKYYSVGGHKQFLKKSADTVCATAAYIVMRSSGLAISQPAICNFVGISNQSVSSKAQYMAKIGEISLESLTAPIPASKQPILPPAPTKSISESIESLNKLIATEKERFNMAHNIQISYADMALAVQKAKVDIKDKKSLQTFLEGVYVKAGISPESAKNRAYMFKQQIGGNTKKLEALAKDGDYKAIAKYMPHAKSVEERVEEPGTEKKEPKAKKAPVAGEPSLMDNLNYLGRELPELLDRGAIGPKEQKQLAAQLAGLREDVKKYEKEYIRTQKEAITKELENLHKNTAELQKKAEKLEALEKAL